MKRRGGGGCRDPHDLTVPPVESVGIFDALLGRPSDICSLMSESKLIALASVVYTLLSSAASRAGKPPRARRR